MQQNSNYYAGLYIRLSKEDENKDIIDNSESVENQKQLLLKYIRENNYNLFDIYIDDGYTGTNFNRPSFLKMIDDIESKKINMVVVKDLSRLGRDYILTGYYTEIWFPKKNIRFISILDNIDSLYDINNEIMPFKSLINDMYSKDNSRKIKAALRIKQQLGKWVGGCPPFGYKSDPFNKNHLIVDYYESRIVKKIFKLFLNGYSISEIRNYLNENKIDTPNIIRKINNKKMTNKWSLSTIKSILTNQLYTGDLIQNRRKKINYKINKIIKNRIEDWIKVENTHEPIITKIDYKIVEEIINNKINIRKNTYILSGLLFCYECKNKIIIQNRNKYTICSSYKKNSINNVCTSHYNNYEVIEKIIVKDIYNEIKNIDKEKIINILEKNKCKKIENLEQLLKDKLKEMNRYLIVTMIRKIEIHQEKSIDIYYKYKLPVIPK